MAAPWEKRNQKPKTPTKKKTQKGRFYRGPGTIGAKGGAVGEGKRKGRAQEGRSRNVGKETKRRKTREEQVKIRGRGYHLTKKARKRSARGRDLNKRRRESTILRRTAG